MDDDLEVDGDNVGNKMEESLEVKDVTEPKKKSGDKYLMDKDVIDNDEGMEVVEAGNWKEEGKEVNIDESGDGKDLFESLKVKCTCGKEFTMQNSLDRHRNYYCKLRSSLGSNPVLDSKRRPTPSPVKSKRSAADKIVRSSSSCCRPKPMANEWDGGRVSAVPADEGGQGPLGGDGRGPAPPGGGSEPLEIHGDEVKCAEDNLPPIVYAHDSKLESYLLTSKIYLFLKAVQFVLS